MSGQHIALLRIAIGRQISHRRKLLEMTRAGLAREMGVRRKTLKQYEAGIAGIPAARISRLCHILGCTADELIQMAEEWAEEQMSNP